MREPTLYILLSLLGGRLHGYGVAQRAAELSDGAVKPTAGTLYGALDRLVGQGLVEVDGEEEVSGRRRRYYRITDSGRRSAVAEVDRMRSVVMVADRLIGTDPTTPGAVARGTVAG